MVTLWLPPPLLLLPPPQPAAPATSSAKKTNPAYAKARRRCSGIHRSPNKKQTMLSSVSVNGNSGILGCGSRDPGANSAEIVVVSCAVHDAPELPFAPAGLHVTGEPI